MKTNKPTIIKDVYKAWTVFEPGTKKYVKFYVVNQLTHQVQSCWEKLVEAQATARDLNRRIKQ